MTGRGDGKLHGGYAATLDSRATPENDRLGGGNPGLRFREAGAQWVLGTANCMAACAATLDSRATPENDRLGGGTAGLGWKHCRRWIPPIARNDGLGGGGGIRPGAIAIFLRKMLSPWGLQGSLRFRLRRKPQCGWIPPSPGNTVGDGNNPPSPGIDGIRGGRRGAKHDSSAWVLFCFSNRRLLIQYISHETGDTRFI